MKLMSHVEYEYSIDLPSVSDSEFRAKSRSHRAFIKQPLTIGIFVPTDLNGNVLSEPMYDPANEQYWASAQFEYEQAKERVLFEGFEYLQEIRNSGGNYTHILKNDEIEIYEQWGGFHVYGKNEVKTIEDLVRLNLTLTQQAIKQIGV